MYAPLISSQQVHKIKQPLHDLIVMKRVEDASTKRTVSGFQMLKTWQIVRPMKSEHLLGQKFQTTSFVQISKYLHLCEEAIWKVAYYHVWLM